MKVNVFEIKIAGVNHGTFESLVAGEFVVKQLKRIVKKSHVSVEKALSILTDDGLLNKRVSEADTFNDELKALLEKYSLTLGVDVIGDTRGLEYNFVVQDSKSKKSVLCEGVAYIDSNDIQP